MLKRMIAVSVAVVGTFALVPAVASAANFNNSVSIRIDPGGKAFKGKVQSPHQACQGNREVILQRKLNDQDNFTKIGTDNSRADGSWSVQTNPRLDAKYRSRIQQKSLSGGNSCQAKNSVATRVRNTAVFIAQNAQGFFGTLLANSVCTPFRTVNLERKTIYQENFRKIGSDLTNRFGDWAVATNVVQGARYRAMAEARQPATNISCKADTSTAITG